MKNLTLYLLVSFLLFGVSAYGWGEKGHAVIASIAEKHLTPKAKKAVRAVLDGHPMPYYSSWMDNLRSDPRYNETSTWHYANVDEGESYQTMKKNPQGDVYTALSMITEKLKQKDLNDSLRTMYTKFLIHLVGDMHCPMHVGRLSDLGGNLFQVEWFGKETNIHSVWDDKMVDAARKWSYTEWAENIDACDAKTQIQLSGGTLEEWINETVDLCKKIYLDVEVGDDLSYPYIRKNIDTVEQQFLKAGYRLARYLNEIYQ